MLSECNRQKESMNTLQQERKDKDNPIKSDFTFTIKVIIISTLSPQKDNLTFTKHEEVDWTILSRRFDHIADIKLATMCQKQLLEGLPKQFVIKEQYHKQYSMNIKQSYKMAQYHLILLYHTNNLLQNNHLQQELIQQITRYEDQIQIYENFNCLLKYNNGVNNQRMRVP